MAIYSTRFKAFAILSFLLFAAYSKTWAQTASAVEVEPTHTIDIREFTQSLNYETASRASARSSVRLGTPAPDNTTWMSRIYNLPDYMHKFYNTHLTRVQAALNGDTNCLVDPTVGSVQVTSIWENAYMLYLTSWSNKIEYTFPEDIDYKSSDAKKEFARIAAEADIEKYRDEIDAFFPYLFMCMNYDNPQTFWLGNSYRWNSAWNYSWNFIQTPGKDYVQYTYFIYFVLQDDDFDYRIYPFRSTQAIKDGIVEYNAAVQNILKDLPNNSRYEQVRYLNNWLTMHNAYCSTYDENTSPSIVWSPISALRGTNGPSGPVCEAYSRAFKVLCDKINIPCVLAVGNAKGSRGDKGESHMWNEVKMNDGQWYAVDVTWNDPTTNDKNPNPLVSGYEHEFWLLLGKNDIVGLNLTFAESHPNSIFFGQDQMSKWDASLETLIADYKFDVANGVMPITQNDIVTVYSITGVKLGSFNTIQEALSGLAPGIYIINGRKTVVK